MVMARKCPPCGGTGKVPKRVTVNGKVAYTRVTCTDCNGKGKIIS